MLLYILSTTVRIAKEVPSLGFEPTPALMIFIFNAVDHYRFIFVCVGRHCMFSCLLPFFESRVFISVIHALNYDV
jgi:hypothetical protein